MPESRPKQSSLKVFVTVDVELWPSSWEGYRTEIGESYRRYIIGRTSRGDYGLPFQLRIAHDHGLRFVCFVESLFACEFGSGYLNEIVQMIQEGGQEIQLHAHPEWVRHSSKPIVAAGKRYLLNQFDEHEQFRLIEVGLSNLNAAGASEVRAFRAGGFAANEDTFAAVRRAGLDVDSSFRMDSTVIARKVALDQGALVDGVFEYPLSVFHDWPGHRRHLQIASCSARELIYVLQEARRKSWDYVVVLLHSAELLNGSRRRPDPIAIRRFEQLCRFLADNATDYETAWFRHHDADTKPARPLELIQSSPWRTLLRATEQGARRLLG